MTEITGPTDPGEVVESVGDGVYALDEAGRFTYVNAALADMAGYDGDELVGEAATVLTGDDSVSLGGIGLVDGEGGRAETSAEVVLQSARGEPTTCEDHARVLVWATTGRCWDAPGSFARWPK